MTDRDGVADWIERYLRAWDSNDPEDIRHAFSDDVEYRFTPSEEPEIGLPALTARWIAVGDSPGDHAFSWRTVAVDGDVAVIQATTRYDAGDAAGRSYANLWVVRIGDDGRASSFTEWFVELPKGA